MSNLSKKIQRQNKKEAEKEFKKKVGLFNKLEDHCLACRRDFNKKNKDMVMTWSVVVKEESVRLYCPTCWDLAQKTIQEMKNV